MYFGIFVQFQYDCYILESLPVIMLKKKVDLSFYRDKLSKNIKMVIFAR